MIKHEFDPGWSTRSIQCNELVMRDGEPDTCNALRSQHPYVITEEQAEPAFQFAWENFFYDEEEPYASQKARVYTEDILNLAGIVVRGS